MYIVVKNGEKFGVMDEENEDKIYEFLTVEFASSCAKIFNHTSTKNWLTNYSNNIISFHDFSNSKTSFSLGIGFDISWFGALLIALSTDKVHHEKVDVIRGKINRMKKLYKQLMWGWYK